MARSDCDGHPWIRLPVDGRFAVVRVLPPFEASALRREMRVGELEEFGRARGLPFLRAERRIWTR